MLSKKTAFHMFIRDDLEQAGHFSRRWFILGAHALDGIYREPEILREILKCVVRSHKFALVAGQFRDLRLAHFSSASSFAV